MIGVLFRVIKFLCQCPAVILSRLIIVSFSVSGCAYVQANYSFSASCLGLFLTRLIVVSVPVSGCISVQAN